MLLALKNKVPSELITKEHFVVAFMYFAAEKRENVVVFVGEKGLVVVRRRLFDCLQHLLVF